MVPAGDSRKAHSARVLGLARTNRCGGSFVVSGNTYTLQPSNEMDILLAVYLAQLGYNYDDVLWMLLPPPGNMHWLTLSYFMQIADVICYAARLKLENERILLAAKRLQRGHHKIYDAIPLSRLNRSATMKRRDAICRA
jgi:hypothetical protein